METLGIVSDFYSNLDNLGEYIKMAHPIISRHLHVGSSLLILRDEPYMEPTTYSYIGNRKARGVFSAKSNQDTLIKVEREGKHDGYFQCGK